MRKWVAVAAVVVLLVGLLIRWAWRHASPFPTAREGPGTEDAFGAPTSAPSSVPISSDQTATMATSGSGLTLGRAPATDARRTAEMRRILQTMFDAGPGAAWRETRPGTTETREKATMPDPEIGGGNQADAGLGKYIAERIHEDFIPLATQCYENALVGSPKLRGKVTVRFKIVGDRRVGAVVDSAEIDRSSELDNPAFQQCLSESMMTVYFAAPPEGMNEITSEFGVQFAPDSVRGD